MIFEAIDNKFLELSELIGLPEGIHFNAKALILKINWN